MIKTRQEVKSFLQWRVITGPKELRFEILASKYFVHFFSLRRKLEGMRITRAGYGQLYNKGASVKYQTDHFEFELASF